MRKRRILLLNPYYYPGYRSGGPQQTFMNLVETFGDACDFYVLTLNHDLGHTDVYENIAPGWNCVGKAQVMYVSDDKMTASLIGKVSQGMDIVYAGGLFERTTRLALEANRRRKISCPLWIAPMGVFSEGAFSQKRWKKQAFICYEKFVGAFRDVHWSFTSELERTDSVKYLGKLEQYVIASDIPRKLKRDEKTEFSSSGELRIIFLSRLCPQKNLLYALNIVKSLKGSIVFDIYGTAEDTAYWKECQDAIEKLPHNIRCNYGGPVKSSEVIDAFSRYDVFLFPTLGENFGHVIYEALASGCVPIISDTTPWSDLKKWKCGEVLPLTNIEKWQVILEMYVAMNNNQMAQLSRNSVKYANSFYENSIKATGYKTILGLGEGM